MWFDVKREETQYTPPPPTREERIAEISSELRMWRAFKDSCEAGRGLREDFDPYRKRSYASTLAVTMTSETAPMWRDLAIRHMEICERRLRNEICGR